MDQSRLEVEKIGDVTIIRFCEQRITDSMEIEELGRELYDMVDKDMPKKLVLNFSAVEFLSSGALGKLIRLNGKVTAAGGTVKLTNIKPQIFEVFQICRLDRLFDIQPDELDALAGF